MNDDGDARWSSSIEQVYRAEYGRVVASLVRRFGDIDVAEEAAGEALLAAVEKWPTDGIPPNPGGWLTVTAGNRAIDRIRRESRRADKHQQALMIDDTDQHDAPDPTGPVSDDRLRLIFTCCHPALAPEARVALTLKLLGGLGVAEIAQAFLVPETTMAQRLTRAKRKIRDARIPYRVPGPDDLSRRLDGVLAVVYLVFNEGYLASSGDAPVREELTGEAIRLGDWERQGGNWRVPRSSLAPILRFADVEAWVQEAPGGGKDGTMLEGFVQVGVAKEDQPHYLKVVVCPGLDASPLVRYGLGVIAARTQRGSDHQEHGVIAPVRTYESPVDRRLEDAGFAAIATVTLLMKETLVRVAEPALVPAGVR